MPRLGLVVNPLAGIGGRVGLKGSDGAETVLRALALGAQAQASRRAAQALQALRNATRLAAQSSYTTRGDGLELLTYPAEMGEEAARQAGWPARVVGRIRPGATSAEDTHRAAQEIESGMTWVNQLHFGYDELPFGGVKDSGIGREHGKEAIEHYLEQKSVVVGGLS